MSNKFEQWFTLNFDIIPKQHKGMAELVWDAAISSLQGEAVEISKDSKLPFDIRIGHGTVGKGCKFSTLLLRINAHNEWLAKQGFHIAPNSLSKIAELEAKLAEVEKVKQVIPCGGCGETDKNKRCLGCMHDFYHEQTLIAHPNMEDL